MKLYTHSLEKSSGFPHSCRSLCPLLPPGWAGGGTKAPPYDFISLVWRFLLEDDLDGSIQFIGNKYLRPKDGLSIQIPVGIASLTVLDGTAMRCQ